MLETRTTVALLEPPRVIRTPERCGLALTFTPRRRRVDMERVEDFAHLGPEHCIPAVEGLGKVLRILRAARIQPPEDPLDLLGDAEGAGRLVERAAGQTFRLILRPFVRVRFEAYTEEGVEIVDDVADVRQDAQSIWVERLRGRPTVRFPREALVRHGSQRLMRWRVLDVERVD